MVDITTIISNAIIEGDKYIILIELIAFFILIYNNDIDRMMSEDPKN